ncbi:non-homologous end-joining DNA ligase [Rhodovulum sp. YNF3179]|uniref:non-homologous end-joining DNA ligase n=1 Tax=Rhodovulum sp. YNF3179 TaxID=3425127 RepID=UPI003D32607A
MSALDRLSPEVRAALPEAAAPGWTAPMLAVLTDSPFSDAGWVYERKLDGERALVFIADGRARLMTRNRKCLNDTYPELVDALEAAAPRDAILDGEIVAFDGRVSSFARLQKRMQIKDPAAARRSPVRVWLYLFDILHLDRRKLDGLPLRDRKKLLRAAVDWDDPLRFTPHRNETGLDYYREACARGWEGVIAKRADAPYAHRRSRDWLKFKCSQGQELVIGGFTAPQGARTGFGALLVGYYEDGDLRYAGKVGTGYDDETLARLHERMCEITRANSPFADPVDDGDVTWIDPELVGAFGFTEWTEAGKLRHPRFLGLRRDKPAGEVVRERPA